MVDRASRILIIDHFEMARAMVRRTLCELQLERIDEANDGQEALDKLQEARHQGDPYSLIFLDWNIPGVNGLEVIEFCRSSKGFRDIPIIMVSSEAEQKQIMKALAAGATDYVVRPCSARTMKRKLERLNEKSA